MWTICTFVDQRRLGRAVLQLRRGGPWGPRITVIPDEAPACDWEGLPAGERCIFFRQKGTLRKKGLFSLV